MVTSSFSVEWFFKYIAKVSAYMNKKAEHVKIVDLTPVGNKLSVSG